MSRRKQLCPKPIKVAGIEMLTSTGQSSKLQPQQSIDNDPDFCPLVIDTSLDSESESMPFVGCGIQRSQPSRDSSNSSSIHRSHKMLLPSNASNQATTVPSQRTSVDNIPVSEYARSSINMTSNCDTKSLRNNSQLTSSDSPVRDNSSNRSHGKGSAPCKTRRKGDRILPVEVDETGSEKFICPVCTEVLLTASDLTKHIRSHNTSKASTNSCTICGKVLSSQSSLDRHMLVHSGERPFQCRVCQMSFTTNGNMHRHMRIHDKGPSGNISSSVASLHKNTMVQIKNHGSTGSNFGGTITKTWQQTPKRKRDLDDEGEPPRKRQITTQGILITPPQPDLSMNSAPADHSLQNKQLFRDKPDNLWPCTVCSKKFLCAYGLESHATENHPELGAICGSCYQIFPTTDELQKHKLTVHSQMGTAVIDRKMDHARNLIPVGFHNLDFLDFSSKAFVNVARVWCEKNQQQPSSTSHDFTCNHCDHAFPTAGTLQLHLDTHSSQTTSMCAICDCTFSSRDAYKNHLPKHLGSDIIARYVKLIGTDDNDIQDCISKPEFMMVLGLQLKTSKASEQKCYRDLNINNVYFEMLPVMNTEKNKSILKPIQCPPISANSEVKSILLEKALLEHLQAPVTKKVTSTGLCLTSLSNPDMIQRSGSSQDLLTSSAKSASTYCMKALSSIHIKHEPSTDEDGFINDASSNSPGGSTNAENRHNSYVCRFCDEIFATDKMLKAHERSHLGLTPYHCNLCNYSSTDKSTLVRHLRTHNGERPFQCRICQFAFTTKANCERHVRKRHSKNAKEDVDAVIGYNKLINDNNSCQEAFASPDTVCKYCGEDFRYFRALKHHLRSHSSCRHKPYMCTLCSAGFSTKANCMRHIQKHHAEVEQNQIERHIVILETPGGYDSADGEKTLEDEEAVFSSTPLARMAGSRKEPTVSPVAGFDMSGHVGEHQFSPYITSPSFPSVTKAEYGDSGFDQPLDFSIKGSKSANWDAKNASLDFPTDEVPIDLSMRKSEHKSPAASYLTADVNSPQNPLHRSICMPHSDEYKKPARLTTDTEKAEDSKVPVSPCSDPDITFLNKSNKFVQQSLRGKELTSSTSNAYNSDSELASITKILDTTDPARFKNFFNDHGTVSPLDAAEGSIQKAQYMSVLANGSSSNQLFECHNMCDQNCGSQSSDTSECAPSAALPTDQVNMQYNEDGEWEPCKKKRNSYSDLPHKLQCPFCPRGFPWISSLNRHILTHTGQKPFKCPQCPVTFSTKSNRERHMVRKHGLDIHDPATRQMMDRPFKCHLCVFSSFSTAGNLLKHYKDRHPEREMPQELSSSLAAHCAMNGIDQTLDMTDSLSTTSDVSNKSLSIHKPSTIQFGDEEPMQEGQTPKSLDLTNHMDHDQSVSASPQVSDPPSPGGSIQMTASFQQHSGTPPPVSTPENAANRHINPERDNYNVDKITECWKCGIICETRKNLLRHLKEHSIDLPFKCYLCDASFSSRLESLEHKVSRHSSDWDMISEKNKIDGIEEFAITQERLVKDTLAGKILKAADDGDDSRIDTDYAQRKVYCSLCIKRFWSLQDLRRHMRSHTGERPFECDICQARFTLKHSMMRHRRKHCDTDAGNGVSDEDNCTHIEDNGDLPTLLNVTPNSKINSSTHRPSNKQEDSHHENGGDLLHDLLGVETSAIDKILNSADDAAALLGIKRTTS